MAPLVRVLILEEAQNLSAPALEALRLLVCERSDTQPPFSVLLIGDEDLFAHGRRSSVALPRGISRALTPSPPEALQDYLQQRLADVGIRKSPFDPAAEELLLPSAASRPRHLNDLLQRSLENAALASRRQVAAEDVQACRGWPPMRPGSRALTS